MFAAEIHEPRSIRFVPGEEPRLAPGDDAASMIFQPELACLCGSDLPYFEHDPDFRPSVGQSLHEMIGRVIDARGGPFRKGDRVLCVPRDHYGFFERFEVSPQRAIPLDPRASDVGALLAQPLGTVICALRKLPNLVGWNVAVVGLGPMGLLFCSALRMVGAKHIVGLDPLAYRREAALECGATAVLDPADDDVVARCRAACGGVLADLVVEAVGHREQTINLCVDLCRDHGDLLSFGVPNDVVDGLRWKRLFWKNITVYTSVGPDFAIDFPLAMQWIAEKRLDVERLATHRFAVAEAQQAFDLFHGRRDGAIKVLLDFTA